ncbi:glycosyl transferase, group 1 [Rhodopirellula maiorica SM1]|uniref:Glycosyl transferase, group 1 n=1 Tax=Rhodopirellula maiorica SM1 TaxID=1265738 RepID=M5RPT6_9BACT|nr:glycosyltransferase family 4 protein [Rhodopirellula maiorica]EMI17397.1 glycosyl transferase, group 1 [Rhodopirellula maiorica SM1]
MKIVCIIHSLSGGGAERVMAALASELSAREHEVVLVTFDDARTDRHEVAETVRRIPLRVMRASRGRVDKAMNLHRRHKAIRKTIATEKPDVVLSFCDRTNLDVLLSTIGLKVPIVISERSDPAQQSLGFFWENMRRRSYKRAARVVALTDAIAKTLAPLSPRPIAVIPSAITPPRCRDIEHENKIILGVGRLAPEKGFDRLIDAFAKIANDAPSWSLKILGEGAMREELQRQADEAGISRRLSMPGWLRPIAPEYEIATLFVLPSRYEGFPSALLEAMATGLPCIAMNCQSGSCEIVTHNENALLVDDSVDALADAMRHLIQNESERVRLGNAATAVVERFDMTSMVDAYEDLLCEVAKDNPKSRKRPEDLA